MIATATNLWEELETALDSLPEGSQVVLDNIGWEDYEMLFEETMDAVHFKMYYDQGRLVAMSLSAEHERIKVLISALIMVLAEALEMRLVPSGGASLKTRRKKKGADPDDSYYIGNADKIRGLKRINLPANPPPDLLIEVDITHPSINKFAIYGAMGVPEFWRYEGDEIHFYQLEGEDYLEVDHSVHFPFVASTNITEFLTLGDDEDIITMVKAFREWVKANQTT
jgi:Uma2 family endonuclease